MDIKFVWSTPTTAVLRDVLESNIRQDIEEDPEIHPCHSGTMKVRLSSSDPLETTINGELVCQCGNVIASFFGQSDGPKLTWTVS
jgi:hypothetical protein